MIRLTITFDPNTKQLSFQAEGVNDRLIIEGLLSMATAELREQFRQKAKESPAIEVPAGPFRKQYLGG